MGPNKWCQFDPRDIIGTVLGRIIYKQRIPYLWVRATSIVYLNSWVAVDNGRTVRLISL